MGKDNENDQLYRLPVQKNDDWRITDDWDDNSTPVQSQPLNTPAPAAPYKADAVAWQNIYQQQRDSEKQARENQNAFFGIPRPHETEAAAAPYKASPESDKLTWGWSGRQMQKTASGQDSAGFNPALAAMQKLEADNRRLSNTRQPKETAPFKAIPLEKIEAHPVGTNEENSSSPPVTKDLTSDADYHEALIYGGLSAPDHAQWVDGASKTPVGQFFHPVILRAAGATIDIPVKVKNLAQDDNPDPRRNRTENSSPRNSKSGLVRSSVETDNGMSAGDYLQMVHDKLENQRKEIEAGEPYRKDGKTTRFGHGTNLAGWGAEKFAGRWVGKTGKVMDAISTLVDAKSAYNTASAERLRELQEMDDETLCTHPRYEAVCNRLREYDLPERAAIVRYAEAKQEGEAAFQKKLIAAGLAHLVDKATGRVNVPQTLRYFARLLKEGGIEEFEEPIQSIRGLLGLDEETDQP